MERLKKGVHNPDERGLDNLDKKELFDKGRHPQKADFYKDQWSFVKNTKARENIAYHLQYMEFMIHLYNDYQVYLTVESLLCKNLIVSVSSVVEAALISILEEGYKNIADGSNQDRNFQSAINLAHANGLIDRNIKMKLQGLRRVRNAIHLSSVDYQEHSAYAPDEVNKALDVLEAFRTELSSNL